MAGLGTIVKSSRIRLARNVENIPFALEKDSPKRQKLIGDVIKSLGSFGKFKVYKMNSMSNVDSEIMLGKHLISKELLANTESGAVLVSEDESLSIMLNEEDHIRAQCILDGFKLGEAFDRICELDDQLNADLNIAYDDKFGYLTSCLTNVGTGLRASVMMFLPALCLNGKLENIISMLKSKGLTVRGELGEGSSPLGYLYQISNKNSIGQSERELVMQVVASAKEVADREMEERKKMLAEDHDMVADLASRAYGIMTNCYLIDWGEFMQLLGELKLGVALNVFKLRDNRILDKLMDICTNSGIQKIFGYKILNEDIPRARAEYLCKTLKNQKL